MTGLRELETALLLAACAVADTVLDDGEASARQLRRYAMARSAYLAAVEAAAVEDGV